MDELLNRLETMEWEELKALWKDRLGPDEPFISGKELLKRQLAARIQEDRHGGLTLATKRRLRDLARAYAQDAKHLPEAPRNLLPSSTLTREWKGKQYSVKVKSDGYEFQGKPYKSLSKIAREITGTRWSGPVFFGLRKPNKKSKVAS